MVLHLHKRLKIWLQPGGHIEAGETPWDAACREAREEGNIARAIETLFTRLAPLPYRFELIVVDDGYDLFLSMVLYPSFGWDEPAYHLDGDPEGRTFAEILVDVVATEVIEPWGGGKWHLEIFRAANAEPEDWNGEM